MVETKARRDYENRVNEKKKCFGTKKKQQRKSAQRLNLKTIKGWKT